MFILSILGTVLLFLISLFLSGKYTLILNLLLFGFWIPYSYTMTENNVGAESLEHEEGVSLRQESNTIGTRSLFTHYERRSHLGGGLAGGK